MKYFLETERLGFRNWIDHDQKIAIELWGDPNVTKFIGGPFSKEQIIKRLSNEINNQNNFKVSYWPFFVLKTNTFIGCCGLKPYNIENNIYELGFHLKKSQWGYGYAKEAALAIINWAFSNLNANKLFAGHHPENKSSSILLKKLGFEYTHCEYYPPTGLQHPAYTLKRQE